MITRERSAEKAQVNLHLGIKGEYEILIKHMAGTSEEWTENLGRHKNKIVNQGLDWWGTVGSGFLSSWGGVAVGTGNSTPSATDTVLNTPLAYQACSTPGYSSTVSTAPYSITYGCTSTFAVGAVIGNVAELGMVIGSPASASAKLFSRALIQVGGSPGTITVLSTDQLIVNYYVQINFPAETSGSFTLTTDGVTSTINWQCLPYNLGNNRQNPGTTISSLYDGFAYISFVNANTAFYPVTQSNEPTGAVNPAKGTYTNGTYNVNWTVNVGTGSLNTYNLVGLATSIFSFQFLLSPGITKTAAQTFQIVYNMSWSDIS